MSRFAKDKPRLCSSGVTSVSANCMRRWPTGERLTADQAVAEILQKCQTMALTQHSRIVLWQPAQFWEFMYLHKNSLHYDHERWLEYSRFREVRKGLYQISGNFVELSYSFAIETYDLALVVEFAKAFVSNPSWGDMIAWTMDCVTEFAPYKRAWGKEYVSGF